MMRDPLDIYLSDNATPEERRLLQKKLAADPELARRCSSWARAVEQKRERWETLLPDRRLLLLHVLETSGRNDLLSDSDRAALEENREALQVLAAEMDSLEAIQQRMADECRAFERAWQEPSLVPRRSDRQPLAPHVRSRRSSRWFWRIPVAAAVALFVVVAVLVVQRDAGLETVATGAGETHLVEFADGSTIRLMENSVLQYVPDDRQSAVNRRAMLDGRAVFDITAQQQGFIVETPVAMATVLGTLFGVDGSGDHTEVTLVEGRLALANQQRKEAAVVLAPGQQSRVTGSAMPTEPRQVDLQEALEWSRLFIFRSTALREIASKLSEHYEVRIVVDASLASEEITGTFEQDEPIISILRTIAAAINARVAERDGALHILPQ